MTFKRRLTAACMALLCLLPLLSTPVWARADELSIPILMYHHIAESESYNTMTVSPQRFREDMLFLAQNGFTPLLPADVAAIAAGVRSMPQRPVMVTFDDGYESNYTSMYPILQETQMKATVNLIAMLIRTAGTGAAWALSWEQCREMYESGLVDFGSHTWNLHNADTNLSFVSGQVNGIQRLADETQADYSLRVGGDLDLSIEAIETNVGTTVRLFAYPFGSTDSWMQPLLAERSLALAVTTGPGLANLAGDLLTLPRYRVDMGTPLSAAGYMQPYLETPLTGETSGDEAVSIVTVLRSVNTHIRELLAALGELMLADVTE